MLKKLLLGIVALIVIVIVVAFALPSKYEVSRSVMIPTPAENVFAQINDLKNWENWTVWNERDPNMKMSYTDQTTSVGAKQSWKSETEGNGELTFTAIEENKRIGYEMRFFEPDMASAGQLVLTPKGDQTELVWSFHGELGNNPIMRYMGLMLDSMVGPDFEKGLSNIKKLAEAHHEAAAAADAAEADAADAEEPSEEESNESTEDQ